MTVPDLGVERLMFFIDQRRDALRMSRTEAAERGLPSPKALNDAAFRGSRLRVRTLRRIDDVLGWEAGSAAATLVGAAPISAAAPVAATRRATSTGGDEVLARTIATIESDLTRAKAAATELTARIAHAEQTYALLMAELEPAPAGDED